jgi:hypothetical protein
MIPLVKLGSLALGLAGWPLELEDDTRGTYEVECGCTPSICYGVCVLPAHTEAPLLSAQSLTFYLD